LDVGGRRLYLRCAGDGGPIVIMEAGLASPSTDWDKVTPGISRLARVCVYDRAGVGKSDPAPRPRDGRQVVDDLHSLLAKSSERPPYVLVGHSFGGLFAVMYAGSYPEEVAGMVLVDSSHEDQTRRFEALMTPEQLRQSRERRANNAEGVNTSDERERVRALNWRTDIPVVVLVHGMVTKDMTPPGWSDEQVARRELVWRELQNDLARRSPRGRVVIAARSGHYIQSDQPELVVSAVREVVHSVRKRKRRR
jgi:pimeloyl-ACP methyl ester carboxylesterase